MGYGYDKEGKTFSYKMGTNNAGLLLKGAKKVPKGTLFFIGQNGQLYMRTGPFLEGDGKFMFGLGVRTASPVVPLVGEGGAKRRDEGVLVRGREPLTRRRFAATRSHKGPGRQQAKTPPPVPWRPADGCCCPSAHR